MSLDLFDVYYSRSEPLGVFSASLGIYAVLGVYQLRYALTAVMRLV